jgi:hypothetical protein
MAAWWKFWNRRSRVVELIYRWRRPRAISFRLIFFLLISATLHLAAFYLFEVVYPPGKKNLPRDVGVWMLPDDDPRIQAVLSRHAGALGIFRSVDAADDGLDTATMAVPFRLSYVNHVPDLVALPERTLGGPLEYPDAVPTDLPPVAEAITLAPATPPPVPAPATITWKGGGGLEMVVPWSGEVPRIRASGGAPAAWEFQIACDRHGRVIEAVVVNGVEAVADASLRRQLLALTVPDALPRPTGAAPVWLGVVVTLPDPRHE